MPDHWSRSETMLTEDAFKWTAYALLHKGANLVWDNDESFYSLPSQLYDESNSYSAKPSNQPKPTNQPNFLQSTVAAVRRIELYQQTDEPLSRQSNETWNRRTNERTELSTSSVAIIRRVKHSYPSYTSAKDDSTHGDADPTATHLSLLTERLQESFTYRRNLRIFAWILNRPNLNSLMSYKLLFSEIPSCWDRTFILYVCLLVCVLLLVLFIYNCNCKL